ncbi:MAG: ABC transporter ATP-binding protein [Bacteroidota bacterium]
MLEIRSVTKYYQKHCAASDIGFTVKPGRIMGLLGPNGAGKTTLLRIILGILQPTSGYILYKGLKPDKKFFSITGYLPEERGLYKKSTVRDVLAYFARLKGMEKRNFQIESERLFERLQVTAGTGSKRIDELSKGNQQKIQFIAAVIHNPEILILDEPFSGFDPVNRHFVQGFIEELRAAGKHIILSTHQMDIAGELCSDIMLIDRGKQLLRGDLADIRQNYMSPRYRARIAGRPEDGFAVLDDLKTAYEILSDDKQTAGGEYIIRISPGENNPPETIIKELAQTVKLREFSRDVPALNEIFIDIVHKKNAENTALPQGDQHI